MRRQAIVLGVAAAAALGLAAPANAAAGFGACVDHTNGTVCIKVNTASIEVRYQKKAGADAMTTFGYRYDADYVAGPTDLVKKGQTVSKEIRFTRRKGKFIQGVVASAGTDLWLGLKSHPVQTN